MSVASAGRPLVIGIGGTFRPNSSTEMAVANVLRHAKTLGAEVVMFGGAALDFPLYGSGQGADSPGVGSYVDALRAANAIVLGSPGYHGSISGLVKNALDYVEELSSDQRAYFDNIPVGCIATGSGWQGANSTLMSLRSIVHALRGWPTPLGLALNTSEPLFDASGACISADIDAQFRLMASQVVAFAESRIADGTDRSKVSQTYSHDNEREAPLR